MTGRNKFLLRGPRATIAFGKRVAKELRPGDVLVLVGNLGSGKTTFMKGLALGLGIRQSVVSPTFLLRKRHPVPKGHHGITGVNHLDAYRFGTADELRGVLDAWSDTEPGDVWAIEWGKSVRHLFRASARETIRFSHLTPGSRQVTRQRVRRAPDRRRPSSRSKSKRPASRR